MHTMFWGQMQLLVVSGVHATVQRTAKFWLIITGCPFVSGPSSKYLRSGDREVFYYARFSE